MKKIKKVIIFSDSHDWHSNELKKELKKLNCKVFCLSLDDCFINTNNKNNIFIPGFSKNLPDGCFIRTIGKGTFQQITRRLTILHVLKKLKVVLFNDVNCIEKATDKSMTTFLLSHNKINTPDTWVPEKLPVAKNFLKELKKKKLYGIWKPLFGSQGKGLRVIKRNKLKKNKEQVYYLQKFEDIKIDVGLDDEFLKELYLDDFEEACNSVDQKLSLNKHQGYDHGYYFIHSFIEQHIEYHASNLKKI